MNILFIFALVILCDSIFSMEQKASLSKETLERIYDNLTSEDASKRGASFYFLLEQDNKNFTQLKTVIIENKKLIYKGAFNNCCNSYDGQPQKQILPFINQGNFIYQPQNSTIENKPILIFGTTVLPTLEQFKNMTVSSQLLALQDSFATTFAKAINNKEE